MGKQGLRWLEGSSISRRPTRCMAEVVTGRVMLGWVAHVEACQVHLESKGRSSPDANRQYYTGSTCGMAWYGMAWERGLCTVRWRAGPEGGRGPRLAAAATSR
jgi:hypothetical protein